MADSSDKGDVLTLFDLWYGTPGGLCLTGLHPTLRH